MCGIKFGNFDYVDNKIFAFRVKKMIFFAPYMILFPSHQLKLVFYLEKAFQKITPKFEIIGAYSNFYLSPQEDNGTLEVRSH